MKIEYLNLHGLGLEEALEKVKQNISWCLHNGVTVLAINHGKGHHAQRGFSVLKQEVRKYLKNEPLLKEYGYKIIYGESDYPVALTFDEGVTLIVHPEAEKNHIGGKKQQEKNQAIFSVDSKKQRKNAKNIQAGKRKRWQ